MDKIEAFFSHWIAMGQNVAYEFVLQLFTIFGHSLDAMFFLLIALMLIASSFRTFCQNETGFKVGSIRLVAYFSTVFFFVAWIVIALGLVIVAYIDIEKNYRGLVHSLGYESFSLFYAGMALYLLTVLTVWLIAHMYMRHSLEPKFAHSLIKKAKKLGHDEAYSDIRELNKRRFKPFNPEKYFPVAMKKRALFLGLDETRKPVYLGRDKFDKSNMQIMGSMGSGKGIQAQIIYSQLIAQGDTVINFDPKYDDHLPFVLRAACQKAGKPFLFLNLREKSIQINPFHGANSEEIADMFIASFDLEKRGDNSDVYKIAERKSAQKIAHFVARHALPFSQILPNLDRILSDEERKDARSFLDALEMLSHLTAFQAVKGADIESVMRSGGCVYIVGDDVGIVQDAQKILLVRILQMIKNIPRDDRQFVSVFADEVKSLLCPILVNQSGQLRSRKANLAFAHQSDADLAVLDNNSREILKDNATLGWFYRQKSPKTAEYVASMTGKINAQASTYEVERNSMSAEVTRGASRRSQEMQRYYIDTNTIQSLPDDTAIFIGDGLAKIAYTSPIIVKDRPALKVVSYQLTPRKETNQQATPIDKEPCNLEDYL
ncbi:type IV secretory system conjugative DNA transfer family protein [Vibrio algivorus]|nr:TraM recognition domain-containing protein [Vibrio algivorus]